MQRGFIWGITMRADGQHAPRSQLAAARYLAVAVGKFLNLTGGRVQQSLANMHPSSAEFADVLSL
jgi:hypothetical protein